MISEDEIKNANDMFEIFKQRLEEEMIHINDFTFNYSLMEFEINKKKISEETIGSIHFHQLGKKIKTNQLKKVSLAECISDVNSESLIFTEICDLTKYFIAYFNTKNEIIVIMYDHVNNIKFEKNIISNCHNIFQIKRLNNYLAVSYQKENNECCIVLLDEELNIINQNDNFCQLFIGQNDSYFYCLNPSNKTSIQVYDQKLNKIDLNGFKLPNDPFNFCEEVKRLEHRDYRYIWLDSNKLNILNDKNGELIKSIKIEADNIEINSKNEIVCLVKNESKLKYFDLYGNLTREFDLKGFTMGADFSFRIDNSDKLHFFDELYVYF